MIHPHPRPPPFKGKEVINIKKPPPLVGGGLGEGCSGVMA
jgi:hypothetical protein